MEGIFHQIGKLTGGAEGEKSPPRFIKQTNFGMASSPFLNGGSPANPIIPRTWFLIEKSSSAQPAAADVFHRCHRQGPFINPRLCFGCKNCSVFWKGKFHWSKHDTSPLLMIAMFFAFFFAFGWNHQSSLGFIEDVSTRHWWKEILFAENRRKFSSYHRDDSLFLTLPAWFHVSGSVYQV